MTSDDIEALLSDFTDRTDPKSGHSAPEGRMTEGSDTERPGEFQPNEPRLDRSFASKYLDELIIGILFRSGETNGMEIIRTFADIFGVQFSPGTVYPHLHSLEEEGVLACRESVQTKEYYVDDDAAGREYISSIMEQMVCMSGFLGSSTRDIEERE